jgi:hypothetical protein
MLQRQLLTDRNGGGIWEVYDGDDYAEYLLQYPDAEWVEPEDINPEFDFDTLEEFLEHELEFVASFEYLYEFGIVINDIIDLYERFSTEPKLDSTKRMWWFTLANKLREKYNIS